MRSERSARPASAARIAMNRPVAPPPTTVTSHSDAVRRRRPQRGRYRIRAVAIYVAHPSSLRHDTGRHPENAGRLGRSRAPSARRIGRSWSGSRRPPRRASGSSGCTPGAHRPDRAHSPSRRRPDRYGHGRQPGLLGGRAARGRRCGWAAERLLPGDAGAPPSAGVRPPGHHAERDRAMGFCLFNNVAVAAADAIPRVGAERVCARLGRPPRQRDRGDLRRTRTMSST